MIDPERPARTAAEFVGQRGVIRRIASRIGADRPQSVAVIGGRKTGKTSLLNYLADAGAEAAPGARLFRMDCGARDAEAFLADICRTLGSGGADYGALRRTVETAHEAGARLVLLLDDFHRITGSAAYPLEFFSFLRSLANNFNVAYVTTSFLELQRLCAAKDVEESPFFNIFTNLTLGPLSAEESAELLAALLPDGAADREELARYCGHSPYLLKLAARAIDEGGWNWEKAAGELFAPYFRQIVSLLPADAYRPLREVARGRRPSPQDAHHLRPLVRQGFLVEADDAVSAFCPAFGGFLRKELSPRMLGGGA